MLRWMKRPAAHAGAVFEPGKPHPTAKPGRLYETHAQVFDGTVVVTLWVERRQHLLADLVKRRVVALGLWDGDAATCALVFAFASSDIESHPGGCAMAACLLPRASADARLAAMAPPTTVVLTTADQASGELLAVERFELPDEAAGALAAAMARTPAEPLVAVPADAPSLWGAARQWIHVPGDGAVTELTTDYSRLEGRWEGTPTSATVPAVVEAVGGETVH